MYLPLAGGRWCSLVTWRDACPRRVVGEYLVAQMPTGPVLLILEYALTLRQPEPGPISTLTEASSYLSAAGRARVAQVGAVPSFSRLGTPYDNAQAGAWGTLKTELLLGGSPFASLYEARSEVAWYFDIYFNFDRRRAAPGYRSPHQPERDRNPNCLSSLSVPTGLSQFIRMTYL